ncbi:hypothetical protein L596_024075 [Steinernema carpocapsae]|uniref:Uncharacterized protein n=1 Tax=Steinernema carpocapsae TaxID=34508 RepID=A0A4V5ZZL0_STECR|nr:hypothetical protein L596_024075 [Steinernema carpocapsae]
MSKVIMALQKEELITQAMLQQRRADPTAPLAGPKRKKKNVEMDKNILNLVNRFAPPPEILPGRPAPLATVEVTCENTLPIVKCVFVNV